MRETLPQERVEAHLHEALEKKQLRPEDFSIRELYEALVPDGREIIQSWFRPGSHLTSVMEATDVKSSLFSNITGQIVYSKILEAYEAEEFSFSKLVDTVPSQFLGIEKIAGIAAIGDRAAVVDEGQPYPMVGVSENYIEVGEKKKRGMIVPVTREAVFSDRTAKLLQECARVGEFMGLNREKRIIDCIVDENAGAASITAGGHRYHWRGTSYATYQTTTPWDNVTASNALVDWTNIEAGLLTMAAITDPFTGEPILVQPTHIIVTPQLEWTAKRIVSATEIRVATPGFATTGNPTQTTASNPVPGYTIMSSRLLKARLATDTDWFLCNPKKAFAYYSNWDIETRQAGANSEDDFKRDIVMQFRVSERGTAATIEPRLAHKSTA